MSPKAHQTIDKHFAALQDRRHGNALQHTLLDIVVISICATICGADGWTEVALWGQSSEAWLCTFLALPHGIPSHDILRLRSGQALWALVCPTRSEGLSSLFLELGTGDQQPKPSATARDGWQESAPLA